MAVWRGAPAPGGVPTQSPARARQLKAQLGAAVRLLIAETAVGTTSHRESQIDALFAGVRKTRLGGAVWFDQAQHAGLYHQDWRLEDDPRALATFTVAVAT